MLLFQYVNPDTGYSHFVNIDLLYEKKCLASLRLKFHSSPRNLQQWPTLFITRREDALFYCIFTAFTGLVCVRWTNTSYGEIAPPPIWIRGLSKLSRLFNMLRAEQVWGDVTPFSSTRVFLPVCIYNEHHRLRRERHGADLISCADTPVCRQVCWVVITSA